VKEEGGYRPMTNSRQMHALLGPKTLSLSVVLDFRRSYDDTLCYIVENVCRQIMGESKGFWLFVRGR